MTTPSAAAARLPWDAANPYPFYERHRDSHGAVWNETARSWLVFGYHAAQQVLGEPGWSIDPRASRDAELAPESIGAELFKQSMLFTDGSDHQRLRATVRDVFTPSFITGLNAGVDSIAAAVIDHPRTGAVFDFMTDIALPMPLAVLGEWLGLDIESSKLLGVESSAIIRTLVPLAPAEEIVAGVAALAKVVAHVLPLAADRRSNPSDDLLSFIAADADLLLDEVVMTALNIAVAGHETTANLMGAAAIRLFTPGTDGSRVIDGIDPADPSLISELLRLDGPAQAMARTATELQRIGDTDIAPGQQVVVVVAAANRDPTIFEEPDRLRLDRRGPAPLSFGYGPHYCLGAALAKLQVDVALRRTLARNPVVCGPPTWGDGRAIRGPVSVPMMFKGS
jgi:cytochrome P450